MLTKGTHFTILVGASTDYLNPMESELRTTDRTNRVITLSQPGAGQGPRSYTPPRLPPHGALRTELRLNVNSAQQEVVLIGDYS
jgi:hypothetical protein